MTSKKAKPSSDEEVVRSTEETIVVRRQWNDYRTIEVPLSVLHDFQIRKVSGGVQAQSPYPMLYGVMPCTAIPEGADFGHSCRHGSAPHQILVCITKKDNPRRLYARLHSMAEQRRAN